jgi:uncharacterized protein (TIGR01777 family)
LFSEENYKGFYWNPNTNEIDKASLEGVDAIIHLVGASVSKRWTKSYKQDILNSRIDTSELLYETLKNNSHTVKHIISASAIGVYPSSETACYTEEYKEVSTSFLGEVVKQWEAAVDEFSKLNIAVSKVRIGVVFSKDGGAFVELIKPIKLGLGANMGSGNQWMSWIHIHDLVRLFVFVLKHKHEGVFNAVAPVPETNKTITKAIAKYYKKPLFLPGIPRWFMKIVLGEMCLLLFESQHVSSKKNESLGFVYKYDNLQKVLPSLIG